MSLKYRLNKTGPNPILYIYCTPFLFLIIFEKPCLKKDNKGCMYVCMYSVNTCILGRTYSVERSIHLIEEH